MLIFNSDLIYYRNIKILITKLRFKTFCGASFIAAKCFHLKVNLRFRLNDSFYAMGYINPGFEIALQNESFKNIMQSQDKICPNGIAKL